MTIYHIVSNKEWGGGEQYVYDLCQRQRADGLRVCIFSKPVADIVRKYEEAGIEVQSLRLGGAADLGSAWRMAQAIKDARPCILHAHNFKDAFTAAYARRLTKNRQVRVVMCRHLTRTGKNTLLYRWLYGQLDRLCFDSALSKEMFLSTHPTIDPQKLCIVPTSIVLPHTLTPAPLRQEFNIAQDNVVAMYHGRLDQEKGLDTLIQAAALLRDLPFTLVLVGRGSDEYTAHLHQAVTDNGLDGRVIFAGFRHPVLPYVASADLGILPSIVREGCPLSPQEYMSQGHPVVATNNGGQREYIDDGQNGLLVEPGRADQLAQALRRLITDAPLRQKLGEQAKADFDDHMNYEHYYAQIRTLYQLPQ